MNWTLISECVSKMQQSVAFQNFTSFFNVFNYTFMNMGEDDIHLFGVVDDNFVYTHVPYVLGNVHYTVDTHNSFRPMLYIILSLIIFIVFLLFLFCCCLLSIRQR